MRLLYLLFFCLCLVCGLNAQTLSVSSFKAMPMDMDARVNHPVTDHNGKKCAIIKVENSNTGFAFDTGTLQVQKVEQKVAEVWVYVQPGVRKITIKHQQLGVLREYPFPEAIKEGAVYVMKLESGNVHTYVEQAPTGAYLVMRLTPSNAVVWIDDEMQTNEDGVVMTYLNNGAHSYRVQAVGYSQDVGKVEINGERKDMQVELISNKAVLRLSCANSQAHLYVDGKEVGIGRWHGELIPGTHVVEVMLDGYRSQTRQVELNEKDISEHTFGPLMPINGFLQISSRPIDTEMWVDGQKVGTTPFGPEKLLIGTHQLELRKAGYQTFKKDITIAEGETYLVNNPLEKVDDNKVYNFVEEMPSFPGGETALITWLNKNIHYPDTCVQTGIQGRVYSSFVVEKDGSIGDIKIDRSPNPFLSEEVERLLQTMPKWSPGKQRGKPVRVKFAIPVLFQLQ